MFIKIHTAGYYYGNLWNNLLNKLVLNFKTFRNRGIFQRHFCDTDTGKLLRGGTGPDPNPDLDPDTDTDTDTNTSMLRSVSVSKAENFEAEFVHSLHSQIEVNNAVLLLVYSMAEYYPQMAFTEPSSVSYPVETASVEVNQQIQAYYWEQDSNNQNQDPLMEQIIANDEQV